jgi:hypothetical protein
MPLFVSVRVRMMPGRMLRVLGRVQMMCVRHVRVMRGFRVVSLLVRLRRFGVVMGGLRVVVRRLAVVLRCLLRHCGFSSGLPG